MKGKLIKWFHEVGKEDVAVAGGKGANLGEMTRAGIPVPPGFIVTAASYFYFLEQANLKDRLKNLVRGLKADDLESLNTTSAQIKDLISSVPMVWEVAEAIRVAYGKLGGFVAVRSSATAEDLPEASFAGQQVTYLNVQGEEAVVKAVQGCWASLFEPRAMFYRQEQGYDHLSVGIAVPVQKMVQSEVSGVLFTVEPLANDPSKMTIEAIYGLGEAIVSGAVTPDLYIIDKRSLSIVEKNIARQEWKIVGNPNEGVDLKESTFEAKIPLPQQELQKLTDEEILALVKIGQRVEELYGSPQDIEWAREDSQFYLVQARPITTLGRDSTQGEEEKISGKVLISGTGASPGVEYGSVKVVRRMEELAKLKSGDVLVAEMTTPDFVPAMKKAVAIVTDKGGRTCHAAIVSRELGIPCVVGTGRATKVLGDGIEVTVDGSQGNVYQGRIELKRKEKISFKSIRTTTKLYVNLSDPDLADRVAQRDVDGVGLLRAEFMIAHVGEHPRYMMEQGRGHEFTDYLAWGIEKFASAFHPRPVVYRTTDFKTNEYRNLKGGEAYEETEENPMIGYRGCSRYLREPDVFRLELEAIKRVISKYDNLCVMLPFVRTPEELAGVKRLMEAQGLKREKGLRLWIMVEVPSAAINLGRFLDIGVDGVSIGSNDLTQLVLGIDRDNARFAQIFDERNEAVLWCLERVVRAARARGVTVSICGQAPSEYPELTERLVEWGATSVSVSPDMIDQTRGIIARVEKKMGKLPAHEK